MTIFSRTIVREIRFLVIEMFHVERYGDKMNYTLEEYDVCVIGAGHAGCMAAKRSAPPRDTVLLMR